MNFERRTPLGQKSQKKTLHFFSLKVSGIFFNIVRVCKSESEALKFTAINLKIEQYWYIQINVQNRTI